MYGSHLSIAGSMVNALNEGAELGLGCVQVFTKNQQQWKARPLDEAMVREWLARVKQLGWDRAGPDGRGGIVSHASYLINLASVSDELWRKSIDLMTDELERCETLAIPYLVHHPGSYVGSDLATGISRIAAAYREVFRRTRGFRVISCLEGTAGAGSQIGGEFGHLATLRDAIGEATGDAGRVAFCLDTCHLHAAGYDMSTRESAAGVFEEFGRLCGSGNLRVLHVNDSKGALGSHLDRHEHIGEGWVGGGARKHTGKGKYSAPRLRASGMAFVASCPALRGIPKILETPKGTTGGGKPLDLVNLARLRMLEETTGGRKSGPGTRGG